MTSWKLPTRRTVCAPAGVGSRSASPWQRTQMRRPVAVMRGGSGPRRRHWRWPDRRGLDGRRALRGRSSRGPRAGWWPGGGSCSRQVSSLSPVSPVASSRDQPPTRAMRPTRASRGWRPAARGWVGWAQWLACQASFSRWPCRSARPTGTASVHSSARRSAAPEPTLAQSVAVRHAPAVHRQAVPAAQRHLLPAPRSVGRSALLVVLAEDDLAKGLAVAQAFRLRGCRVATGAAVGWASAAGCCGHPSLWASQACARRCCRTGSAPAGHRRGARPGADR